jgi:hypothetical protein
MSIYVLYVGRSFSRNLYDSDRLSDTCLNIKFILKCFLATVVSTPALTLDFFYYISFLGVQ